MILLKSIPKVDKFIAKDEFKGMSTPLISTISKKILQNLRDSILNNEI